MSLPFSESDLDRLRERVAEAEGGTPGEIVVFVVPRSSSYEAVLWRGAALGILLVVAVWLVLSFSLTSWGSRWLWSPTFLISMLGVGAIIGASCARVSGSVFRFLAGRGLASRTVRDRARRVFLLEGVTETADRTGILLFVSVLERRIEVLADRGISAAVSTERWVEIVDLVRAGLRRGDLVGGLSEGISACGDVLRASGLKPAKDDRNELSDDVRFESD